VSDVELEIVPYQVVRGGISHAPGWIVIRRNRDMARVRLREDADESHVDALLRLGESDEGTNMPMGVLMLPSDRPRKESA
jgi:hypothetical protein